MDNHTRPNTILLWTKNKNIVRFATEIAKELKVEIYKAEEDIDLIAIRSFLIIVDRTNLKKFLINRFKLIAKFIDPEECSILVIGKKLTNEPNFVNPLIEYAAKDITREYLQKLIEKAMTPKKITKKDIFKDSTTRVDYLNRLLYFENIEIEDSCKLFEVDKRTLKQDINALKKIRKEIIYYSKKNGYYVTVMNRGYVKVPQYFLRVVLTIFWYPAFMMHELSHALISILFFRIPKEISFPFLLNKPLEGYVRCLDYGKENPNDFINSITSIAPFLSIVFFAVLSFFEPFFRFFTIYQVLAFQYSMPSGKDLNDTFKYLKIKMKCKDYTKVIVVLKWLYPTWGLNLINRNAEYIIEKMLANVNLSEETRNRLNLICKEMDSWWEPNLNNDIEPKQENN